MVDDWNRFQPLRTGLALACTLHKLYPDDWKTDRLNVLLGHKATADAIRAGKGWQAIEKTWQADLAKFRDRRRPFLLYPE